MTRARSQRGARSRRGLTLVELLAALALLSVFVLAAVAWTGGAVRLRAAAAHNTQANSSLNAVEELLRRDLAERPIDGTPPAPGSPAPGTRRAAASAQPPRLPFEVVAAPDAMTLTMVTASLAPGDASSGHGGWRTVAWRYDAARGELLRGSWPYSREHAAAAPMAVRDAPGVRVALRGIRAFDLQEIEWPAPDATADRAGESPTRRAIVARIQLETGEQAAALVGEAP